MYSALSILIIEPNRSLTRPYMYLPATIHVHRVTTSIQAKISLSYSLPALTLLSASLPIQESLDILDLMKNIIKTTIPPIIFVVDFSYPISTIPGTTWAGKSAVIDALIYPQDFLSTITRLM